jgi:hypothetical protein
MLGDPLGYTVDSEYFSLPACSIGCDPYLVSPKFVPI